MIDHILPKVQVEEVSFLSIDDSFLLKRLAFALEASLQLLLRIGAIDIPIHTLNLLFEETILL